MAVIQFSPLIVGMSGKVADAVFSRWKGIPYIRARVIPSNPRTADQTEQREALAHCLKIWQSIKSWAKTPWDLAASGYAMSGYNKFMDLGIPATRDDESYGISPANPKYIPITFTQWEETIPGTVVATWTDDDASADDKCFIAYRLLTEWALTKEDDVAASAETASIADVPAGAYDFHLVAYDTVSDEYAEDNNQLLTVTE
ncbi:hypothetical protein ES705_23532 [subsurface metagenome]